MKSVKSTIVAISVCISFIAPVFAAGTAHALDDNDLVAVVDGDVTRQEGTMCMKRGQALLVARRPMIVTMSGATLAADAGAIILIKTAEKGALVRVLSDRKSGSVKFAWHDWNSALAVGQEAIIAADNACFQQLLADGLGRRLVHSFTVDGGRAQVADISLQDNLVDEPLIVALRADAHSKERRQAVNELLKTAAIYNMIQSTAGQYRRSL